MTLGTKVDLTSPGQIIHPPGQVKMKCCAYRREYLCVSLCIKENYCVALFLMWFDYFFSYPLAAVTQLEALLALILNILLLYIVYKYTPLKMKDYRIFLLTMAVGVPHFRSNFIIYRLINCYLSIGQ